jgi:hypothetical protein
MAARKADSYRGARRNAARKLGLLRREDRFAAIANAKAKLPERRQQCRQARDLVGRALAERVLTTGTPLTMAEASIVLRDFWRGQPATRVTSRILRELGANK